MISANSSFLVSLRRTHNINKGALLFGSVGVNKKTSAARNTSILNGGLLGLTFYLFDSLHYVVSLRYDNILTVLFISLTGYTKCQRTNKALIDEVMRFCDTCFSTCNFIHYQNLYFTFVFEASVYIEKNSGWVCMYPLSLISFSNGMAGKELRSAKVCLEEILTIGKVVLTRNL